MHGRGKSQNIFEELYGNMQMHHAKKEKKRDIETSQIEYERSKEECTFKPSLYKSSLRKKSPSV